MPVRIYINDKMTLFPDYVFFFKPSYSKKIYIHIYVYNVFSIFLYIIKLNCEKHLP